MLTIKTCQALLLGILLAGNAAAGGPPVSQYAGGDGSELSPWQISNLAELRVLSETSADWVSGKFFIVTADIDAADTASWNGSLGFSPIGKIGGIPFEGNFDGNGKVISNLHIDRPAQTQVGLFGGQKNGTIKNTHLSGCFINGLSAVGSLVGWNRSGNINSGTALSCTVTSTVVDGDVGGLVGYLESGSITLSQSSGQVAAVLGINVGGLVGSTYQASITSSSSSAVVTGASNTGGLVGYFNQSMMMSNSASGNVEGTSYVGGLVGRMASPTGPLTFSHASGAVTGSENVGGLIGGTQFGNVSNSYAIGPVIAMGLATKMGGLIGFASGTALEDSYAKGDVSGIESVGGLIGEANGGSISRCYATGQVSQSTSDSSSGFFGGLVGFADANITSSTASGSVSAADFDNVGGLVGRLGGGEGEINSSYAKGAVDGNDRVGGLFGSCEGGYATSSYATGVVTGVGANIGALAGYNINCLTAGLPSYWLDPTGSTVGIGFSSGASAGASGLTAPQMLLQNSFVGFVFPATWLIIEGQARPYLAWQSSPWLIFTDGFETAP